MDGHAKPCWIELFLEQHKDAPNPAAGNTGLRFALGLLLVFITMLPGAASSRAQTVNPVRLEPTGSQIQATGATWGGNGLQLGIVSARSVFTREIIVLMDAEPVLRDVNRQARVVLLPGVSLRAFGFERLIGGAAYRGFDLNVGFRAGPGITFGSDESLADRNRRFELVLEPFIRITARQNHSLTWLVELGSTRPAARAGFWIKY